MERLEKKSHLEAWTAEVDCENCGTWWKVTPQDIQMEYESYPEATGTGTIEVEAFGFVCPECHKFTQIRSVGIPQVIKNQCFKKSGKTEKKRFFFW